MRHDSMNLPASMWPVDNDRAKANARDDYMFELRSSLTMRTMLVSISSSWRHFVIRQAHLKGGSSSKRFLAANESGCGDECISRNRTGMQWTSSCSILKCCKTALKEMLLWEPRTIAVRWRLEEQPWSDRMPLQHSRLGRVVRRRCFFLCHSHISACLLIPDVVDLSSR